MDNDEDSIEGGYVIMPRNIARDSRNGLMTNPERNLLLWIRLIADVRGVSHCSMKGLADEAFNDKVSNSYINKILRSLKKKRYLWYQDRNGRRGTFEIHLRDWFLKDKVIKDITNLFEKESVKAQSKARWNPDAKPRPISEEESQSIVDRRKAITAKLSMHQKQL